MKDEFYFVLYILIGMIMITCLAQAAPTLNLLISSNEEFTIKQGQPLVFDISMVDYYAQTKHSENIAKAAEKEWLDQELATGNITKEDYELRLEKLEPTALNPTIFGSDEHPWFEDIRFVVSNDGSNWQSLDWDIYPLIMPKANNYIEINQSEIAFVSMGIDPDITNTLSTGDYLVNIYMTTSNTITNENLPDTLWATPVKLSIAGEAGELSTWAYDNRLELAMYWLRRGEYQKALDDANYLLSKQPKDIDAMQIKADALAGLGEILQAIDIFQQAIELYENKEPQPSCPPDYLIDRYQELIWEIGPATE